MAAWRALIFAKQKIPKTPKPTLFSVGLTNTKQNKTDTTGQLTSLCNTFLRAPDRHCARALKFAAPWFLKPLTNRRIFRMPLATAVGSGVSARRDRGRGDNAKPCSSSPTPAWERAKENVLPLARGRDVNKIALVTREVGEKEDELNTRKR